MKRILAFTLALIMTCASLFAFCADFEPAYGAEEGTEISIIFTGDLHSNEQPIKSTNNGYTSYSGGYAKAMTVFEDLREAYPSSFTLDGGDFSMGSPYQAITVSTASELVLMGAMGIDVTTFGNHDFDYGPSGTASMLNNAAAMAEEGQLLPFIVGTNINWEKTLLHDDLRANGEVLKAAFDNYGVADYTVLERDGVRIAVFGVEGEESISNIIDEGGVIWDTYIDKAKVVVDEIQKNEDVDLIVCLSHSGVDNAEGTSGEDIELAKAVPEIDVILSAHSHYTLEEPVIEGNTIIIAGGAYAASVGHLVVNKTEDGCEVVSYDIIPLDDSVAVNRDIQAMVDSYIPMIDEQYFSRYGYSYNQVIVNNPYEFVPIDQLGADVNEETLGNILADALIFSVKLAEGENYEPIDVAVVPSGVIRASIPQGDVTVADIFNICPLGMGQDGLSAYPLVSVYVTGAELKSIADIDISLSPMLSPAHLYFSGLEFSYNKHRMFLNRTFDIKLVKDGEEEKIVDDQLYRVVADYYTGEMLGLVNTASHGLISLTPKDKDGNPLDGFKDCIIYYNGAELKEWQAIAMYMDSFEGGVIPEQYAQPEGRKDDRTSFNPITILKQPNKFTFIAMLLGLIPIAIIVLIVHFVRKRRAKKRGYKHSVFNKYHKKSNKGKPEFKYNKSNLRKLRKK